MGGMGVGVYHIFRTPVSDERKMEFLIFFLRQGEKKKDAHFQKDFSKFSQNRVRFNFY